MMEQLRALAILLSVLQVSKVKAECKITKYGALGDGQTLNTVSIQRAIDDPDCDDVYVPVGVFLTGALNLTSHMTLRIDGVLRGSADEADYPVVPALESYGSCRDTGFPPEHAYGRHQALISGWHLDNVTLKGAGVIDGNGAAFWARNLAGTLQFGRPRLIEPMYSSRIRIFNLNLKDSAFWTVHPYACNDVHIADVVITAPRNERAPNTDGIDPDSCSDVLVERVYVDTGDNAVAVKSGYNEWGRKFGKPSRNMIFRDSYFVSASVAVGSEMSGGVYNVTFDRCVFGDPFARVWKQGFTIKSALGRGGVVRDIRVRNSIFHSGDRDPSGVPAMPPISVNMFYPGGPAFTKEDIKRDPGLVPRVHDITFENIIAEGSGTKALTGEFLGLVDSPIANVRMRNFTVLGKSKGWLCSAAKQVSTDGTVVPPGMPTNCPFYPSEESTPLTVVRQKDGLLDCSKTQFDGPMAAYMAGCFPMDKDFERPKDPGFLFGSTDAQIGSTSQAKLPMLPFGLALMRYQHTGHDRSDGMSGGGEDGAMVTVGGKVKAQADETDPVRAVTLDELRYVCIVLGGSMVLAMSLLTWWLKRKFRRMKAHIFNQQPDAQEQESQPHTIVCPPTADAATTMTPNGRSKMTYEPPQLVPQPVWWRNAQSAGSASSSCAGPYQVSKPGRPGGMHKSPSLPSDMGLTHLLLSAEEGEVRSPLLIAAAGQKLFG